MPTDLIRYDLLVQDALRSVVRRVLSDAARNGLPGEHHFNISFKTQASGVAVPPAIRQKYPDEMTIILQHQFWDLKVGEDEFEVGLSFGGIPEKLTVPFEAINGFFDPSVQFGLQFEEVIEGEERPAPANAQESLAPTSKKKRLPVSTPATPDVSGSAPAARPSAPAVKREKPDKPAAGGGEVVRLDRFRKK